MTNQTFVEVMTFAVEVCCECSTPFGLLHSVQRELRNNGKCFYCPNGHPQHYTKSEITKLKEEVERQKRWRESAEERARANLVAKENVERKLAAKKGQITKMKKRVAQGVCPCCNRQFLDLQRHMGTKHPEYVKGANNNEQD